MSQALSETSSAAPSSSWTRRAGDQDLVNTGLLDKIGGSIRSEARKELSFELKTSLPTPGLYVKGCIDECSTCDPMLQAKKKLELERMKLDNKMLERQIELLDKAQEYRCCPQGESEEEGNDD